MPRRIQYVFLLLLAVISLTGCSLKTVEQMYALPKRSESYNNLQSAIDGAMTGLEYSAPLSGENQQTVQMIDLDGDGTEEFLLFAKGGQERPMKILIFQAKEETYIHVDTVSCNGSTFDLVEYVEMDGVPGLEIVVGRQLSGQVIRSASVYSFTAGEMEQLLTVNYTKFMTADMDDDGLTELLVLRPGQTETDNGIVTLYGMEDGAMERANEVSMSQPADKLKRIILGQLQDGVPAVYVASSVDDTAIITDVYAVVNGLFTNVSYSNESGTSVQTLRNFYVYADDIDNDGVVELPYLITMKPVGDMRTTDRHHLIRWFSMTTEGKEVDKLYTYHNFVGGWYIQLGGLWASRVSVVSTGNQYEFYLWDEEYATTQKIMTIYALTGQNREEQGGAGDKFVLYRTDSAVFAATIHEAAQTVELSRDSVIYSFRMIRQDWKTGET